MTHRRLAAAVVVVVAVATAAPASASVAVAGVDAASFPTIHLTVVSSAGAAVAPSLMEDGHPVVGLTTTNLGRAKAVVLAVDDSRSMKGRPLADAIAAARGFAADKPAADAVAVEEFGPTPVLLSGLSTATIDADAALRNLGVASRQGTALYDAVVTAAKELAGSGLAGRVLIVLTDGRDVSSRATLAAAIAEARKANVGVYAIGLEGVGFDPAALQELASQTGGRYYAAASTRALSGVYASIANRLGHTWRLSYVSAGRPGDRLALRVGVAGAGSAAASFAVPTAAGDVAPAASPSRLLPAAAYGALGTAALATSVGVLVLLAVFFVLGTRRGAWLRGRLAAHTGGLRPVRRSGRQRLVGLAALTRATEGALGQFRPWQAMQRMLDRGDTPLRAAELFYICAGTGIVVGFVAAVAGLNPIVILGAVAFAGAAPLAVVWQRMHRRLRAFETQLPDLLITIAASLKAGHSFKQGLQAVVDEGQPPASSELKRVLTESGLGRPLDESLADMSGRVGSENFEFAITAVTIQRQVGGSLASLFDMVADTVRQRQQFARKIRSLTAMGRMSAYTLIGLPFFLMLAISVMNPGYLHPLFHTHAGHMLLVFGAVLMAIGSAILKKIVSFRG
jgi:tight adherence protein B